MLNLECVLNLVVNKKENAMSEVKVLLNFGRSKYTDSALSSKTWHVIEKMTNNANFPDPLPSLEELENKVSAFDKALGKVQNGTKEDTYFKNELRVEFEKMMKNEGMYVQVASNGNVGIMLSSGFDVSKEPEFVGPLEKPTGLTVKPGRNNGSVEISCDKVNHAVFYEYLLTKFPITPSSIWEKLVSTKGKLLIENLEQGAQYGFKVAGGGSDPSRNWSDQVNSYIL
jgi:hypothetical protein